MQTTTPPITFDPAPRGPLHGVRILDLSRLVAGNMLLGEHTDAVLGEAGFDTDTIARLRAEGAAA
jgi:crotonobetainyl-CoA:carnitine CoA-transferase CaiB-like acyl-CoA transferase